MKNKFLQLLPLISLFFLSSESGLTQTALFKDGVLTIPNTAVTEAGEVQYYSNVKLRTTDKGSFELLEAQRETLVSVDSVTITVADSLPLQATVTVKGNKSLPCTKLLEPGIFMSAGKFTVALAESSLGPAETCIAVIDPFETSLTLDVSNFAAGTYSVEVNGTLAEFTI